MNRADSKTVPGTEQQGLIYYVLLFFGVVVVVVVVAVGVNENLW